MTTADARVGRQVELNQSNASSIERGIENIPSDGQFNFAEVDYEKKVLRTNFVCSVIEGADAAAFSFISIDARGPASSSSNESN